MRMKPVPLKEGYTIETVEQFLARGGKVKKLPEGKAEGVWTAQVSLTAPPVVERSDDPIDRDKLPASYRNNNHTQPITGEFK